MLKLIILEEVGSTNDFAKSVLEEGQFIEDTLIIAKTQTSGRGRLNGRTWVSQSGNFHGSYVINIEKLGLSENDVAILNSLTLLSIQDELDKFNLSKENITIKYPNDILINGKKIAGVLIEILYPHAIIGIGINVCVSPIERATDIKSEFNIHVDLMKLGENLYKILVKRIANAKI